MLKATIAAIVTVLLNGCAAFSHNDGVKEKLGSETRAVKQAVTGSMTLTAADPAAVAADPPSFAHPAESAPVNLTPGSTKAEQATAVISTTNPPASFGYRIGPQDVLDITVFKVSELSKAAQVSEAGTISYPLVGDVVVAGKTPREVGKELTTLLGAKYLRNPQVSVYVKEFNSQRVTLEGAIKKPGVFPINGSLSLLQAVALAQGLEDISDDTVLIFRNGGGKRAAARFNIADIRAGDAEDPQLQAGDLIIAGKSALKEGWGNVMKVMPVAGLFAFL